ncbi:uncharacterized protein RCH25_025436 [Pelodytes ibericus]
MWNLGTWLLFIPIPVDKESVNEALGRTCSETYCGLIDVLQDEQDQESVPLPGEVTPKGSKFTILKYFIHLAKNEDEEVSFRAIDELITEGSDVNEEDRCGQTVMHVVAKSWHTEVAQFLIERKADLNKPDHFGVTPLHVAAAMDYSEMVTLLLKQGGNINANTNAKQSPLHYAAKYDAVHSLKVLLKHEADTKVRDYKQRTPLHLAAELDRSEAARLLLNLKCDAAVQDDTGLSCLTLMVVNMPPVAFLALDQFHIKDRANRKQHFFLNHVEPQTPGFLGSQAKSPLEVIVQSRQLDIIMHPVIQKLIDMKWNSFGRKNIALMLSLNLLFILSWTALGIASSLPRTEDTPYKFPEDSWRIIVIFVALGLTIYQIVEEFREIYHSKIRIGLWKDWRRKELEKDLKYCHPMWPEEEEYLQKGIEDLQGVHPAYLKDFWNVFDWIVYFLLLAVILTHIADVVVQHNQDLHTSHVRVFSVTIIFLWLRLMKHARAIRLLGPFIVMLGKIMTDVLKFLFLYGEFYIPYACAFWIIFGGQVDNMSSVPQLLFTIFRITLVDDYNFADMYSVDPVMAYILCGTFLGVSAILCINLLIALLADTFQRVYDNATANAVMQQASTLLQIEENLSKKSKAKFSKHIQTTCSPLTLFYDDDLTVDQDDDLKKVTIQIKEELGELMHIVKEKKLKSELQGMQKKRSNHGTLKPSPKLGQSNSTQRPTFQQPETSASLLATLLANQQEQRETLLQMGQKLQSLETMICQTLRPSVPSGWEQMETQRSSPYTNTESLPKIGQVSMHPTDQQYVEPQVTIDIIGRTRDQPSYNNGYDNYSLQSDLMEDHFFLTLTLVLPGIKPYKFTGRTEAIIPDRRSLAAKMSAQKIANIV